MPCAALLGSLARLCRAPVLDERCDFLRCVTLNDTMAAAGPELQAPPICLLLASGLRDAR